MNNPLLPLELEGQPLPPLPNELPARTSSPPAQLRSATVEALINQNEDLSARLAVNLRRMSLLENRLEQVLSEQQNLQGQYDAVVDQYMILKNKDDCYQEQVLAERKHNAALAQLLDSRTEELKIADLRCQELACAREIEQSQWQTKLAQTHRKLLRLQKYRSRIRRLTHLMREDLALARAELDEQLLLNQNLKQHWQLANERLHSQARDFEKRLALTREQYERKLSEAESQPHFERLTPSTL